MLWMLYNIFIADIEELVLKMQVRDHEDAMMVMKLGHVHRLLDRKIIEITNTCWHLAASLHHACVAEDAVRELPSFFLSSHNSL